MLSPCRTLPVGVLCSLILSLWTGPAAASDTALVHAQHAYVAAMNANDPDRILETVTRDVVFIAPDRSALEGQTQLRAWARRHFKRVAATWEKTPLEVVISGDWAFETYKYRTVDTPRGAGPAMIETGNGLSVYQRLGNGDWRIARDVWATHDRWEVFEDNCAFTRLPASPC